MELTPQITILGLNGEMDTDSLIQGVIMKLELLEGFSDIYPFIMQVEVDVVGTGKYYTFSLTEKEKFMDGTSIFPKYEFVHFCNYYDNTECKQFYDVTCIGNDWCPDNNPLFDGTGKFTMCGDETDDKDIFIIDFEKHGMFNDIDDTIITLNVKVTAYIHKCENFKFRRLFDENKPEYVSVQKEITIMHPNNTHSHGINEPIYHHYENHNHSKRYRNDNVAIVFIGIVGIVAVFVVIGLNVNKHNTYHHYKEIHAMNTNKHDEHDAFRLKLR